MKLLSEVTFEELKNRLDAQCAALIDDEGTSERGADHLETMLIDDLAAIERVMELAASVGLLDSDGEPADPPEKPMPDVWIGL